jgi:hypothetical protein
LVKENGLQRHANPDPDPTHPIFPPFPDFLALNLPVQNIVMKNVVRNNFVMPDFIGSTDIALSPIIVSLLHAS